MAYYEFTNKTCCQLTLVNNNLLVTRTFSKAFVLANFRAGYLKSSSENIKEISKIRNPKNIPTFTQLAMIAALKDIDYLHKFVNVIDYAKQYFKESIETFPFIKKVYASDANSLLIEFERYEIKIRVFEYLVQHNIFVRNLMHHEMLMNTFGVTIATRTQMQQVIKCLKNFDINDKACNF